MIKHEEAFVKHEEQPMFVKKQSDRTIKMFVNRLRCSIPVGDGFFDGGTGLWNKVWLQGTRECDVKHRNCCGRFICFDFELRGRGGSATP